MNDDAWNLIGLGRYDEAARQLARFINDGVDVALNHFGNKAVAELAAGRLGDAERTLKEGEAFAQRSYRGSMNLLLNLSEVQWLNGHVEEAVGSLMARIHGLEDGSVTYADSAGGGTEGLILYYYGIRLDRASPVDDAQHWLKQVKKRNRAGLRGWPGPLVRWFLGELDEAAIMTQGCGATSMEVAVSIARTDILARRQLVEICFHMAVRALREEKHSRSQELFETSVSLANPLVSEEWYLARYEADRLKRISN